MSITMQSVRLANELHLTYSERGDPAGTPLLLVHGFTDSHRSFEGLMEHLPSWMRVSAVSQRGHGDSDRPTWGYRTRDFAEDLRLFAGAMGIERAVVVGHSMGAANALRLALDAPELVRGLVLIGAFATFSRNAGLVEFWETGVRSLTDPIPEAFVREFQLSTLARGVSEEFLQMVVDESLKVPSRAWRGAFAGLLEDDFAGELERVSTPTLLVWGEKDAMSGRGDQEELRRRIAGAELVVYGGAGHGVHWEEPSGVARDVAALVERIGGQASE